MSSAKSLSAHEITPMQIEAQVDGQGILHTALPEEFHGKRVRVSVDAIEETPTVLWEVLAHQLDQLDQLSGPKLSHAQILESLRTFRED